MDSFFARKKKSGKCKGGGKKPHGKKGDELLPDRKESAEGYRKKRLKRSYYHHEIGVSVFFHRFFKSLAARVICRA